MISSENVLASREKEMKFDKREYQKEYMRKRLNCKKTYRKHLFENHEDYATAMEEENRTRCMAKYKPVERTRCECGKEIFVGEGHRTRHLASQLHKTMMAHKEKMEAQQDSKSQNESIADNI